MRNTVCKLAQLAIGVLSIAAPSLAIAQGVYPIVKVRSVLGNGPAFSGSGILVSEGGRTLVLTSEHVVFHAARGAFNSVETEGGVTAPASLRAVDWGIGLALLEVEGDLALTAKPISLRSFADIPDPGAKVALAGFPFHSQTPLIDSSASVLNPRSDRHEIALLDSMVELSLGSHAEYGMSGGGAFSFGTGKLVGILSHQFVELVPGRPSRIGSLEAGLTERQNHVLLISAADARVWLEKVLKNDSVPSFVLAPEAQASGRVEVLSGGLRFVQACGPPPSVKAAGVGGGDGAGIGGGEGAGIGGGDGAGIGGGESGTAVCRIQVTLRRADSDLPASYTDPAVSGWSNAVVQALRTGREVVVTGFLSVDGEGDLHRRPSGSLPAFFRDLRLGVGSPLTEVAGGRDVQGNSMIANGHALVEAVGRARAEAGAPGLAARRLLDELESVGSWSGSLARAPLSSKRVSILDKDPAWDVLFRSAFDPAVDAMKRLILIQREAGGL
jgi:hypothetical protein